MEPRGSTSREQKEKRDRLKAAIIAWANLEYCSLGLHLRDDDGAIADTLAIAKAAHSDHPGEMLEEAGIRLSK
jgi:hypothetical protein